MNEKYLKGLHSYLEIEDDYDTWISSISNNDEYLKGLHKYLEIEDDYDVWNSSVFGSKLVSTEIEEVETPVEETKEPVEEVEIEKEDIKEPLKENIGTLESIISSPFLYPTAFGAFYNIYDFYKKFDEVGELDLDKTKDNIKLNKKIETLKINDENLEIDRKEKRKQEIADNFSKGVFDIEFLDKTTKTGLSKEIEPAYLRWQQTGEVDMDLIPKSVADPGFGYEQTPSFGKRVLNILGEGYTRMAKGMIDWQDMWKLKAMDLAVDIMYDIDEQTSNKVSQVLRGEQNASNLGLNKKLDDLSSQLKEYDTETIVDDIAEGNYFQAGERIAFGMIGAIPSLTATMLGPGGLIAIGMSSAGNKFDQEFSEDPEQGLDAIILNSTLTGSAEAIFERFTQGLLKKAGLIRGSGNIEAAEKLINGFSNRFLKPFVLEPFGEGLSEAATVLTQDLVDAIPKEYGGLGKDFDLEKTWKRMQDAGLIGFGVGQSINTAGALKNSSKSKKSYAETVLMPESDKKIIKDAALNINELNKQFKQVYSPSQAQILNDKIEEQQEIITKTKKKVNEELNLMNKEELLKYAENKSKIEKIELNLKSSSKEIKDATIEELEILTTENEALIREAVDRRLDENIKTVGVEDLGRTVNDYNSKEEYQKAYDNTEQGKKNSMNVTSSDGFISEDGDIYINREVAQKVRNVNVAAHELLHGILNNNIKEPGQLKKLVNEFKAILPRDIANKIQKRIDDNYRFETDEQGNRVERPESEYMEEYFTAFADLIGNRQIKFNENIFGKIGEKITPIFKGKGYGHIKFETGKDVYNFIKDYQKQIAKGELKPETIEAARKIAQQDVKMSKTASDKVQEIYNDQGVAGALDIIQEFKPIVNKIVERRREAPGFDRQLLTDEIETGERGILDLIQAYDPKSGVPLAAYINKFLPSRAIEASKRVLGEVFEDDVAERVDIAGPTTAVEEVEITEKPKAPVNLRRALDIEKGSDLYNKVKDVVAKTFGTRIPSPTDPKFKKTLQDAYATELTNDVKELMGKPSSDKYKTFLQKYGEQIYDLIPQDILNKSYQDFIVEEKKNLSPTEVDDAISKGLLPPDTPRTAGPSLFSKKPYNQEEFVEFHLAPKKGRPASKQTQLAQTIAKELGKDATLEVLEDPKVFERFTEVQEIEGKKVTKETKPKVAEKIQREPGVKFSKNIDLNVNEDAFAQDYSAYQRGVELPKQRKEIVEDYIAKQAFEAADKGKSAQQFMKVIKSSNDPNIPKDGYYLLSDKKFKENKKALNEFGDSAMDLASQVPLTGKIKNTYRNIVLGLFAGHYNIVGSELAKVNSSFKTGIVNNLNSDKSSVLSKETQERWKNFPWSSLKSSYASEFKTALKKIYASDNLASQKQIAKEVFDNKQGKAALELYDLWNTTLQEWLYSSKPGSKDFNKKADYILKLKKSNSAIGTTGERILAPPGYVYLPGKVNKGTIKFEHLKSSSEQSLESAILVLNNKWGFEGKKSLEGYNGIYGMLEDFNIVDEQTGKVNDSSIFRFAESLELAKNIYSVKSKFTKTLYDDIVDRVGDKVKQFEKQQSDILKDNKNQTSNNVVSFSKTASNEDVVGYAKTVDEALANARKLDAPVKKIRVFDFDDTLAQTKSIVFYTKPDGTEGQLTAEEFAEKGADLVAEGAVMDFSDFNIVREGKRGPLFDVAKKIRDARGNEDLFVLTARAPESANAIYEFLKSEGLEFKRENIVGLGNSTGAAKANWIVGKAAEGYNDFYFADDAFGNVQAVQDALDQIDVKSKVQQAKVKFSKSINEDFNKIIEQKTGIASEKRYSKAKAKVRGANKGNKKFFIPYSAEDFMGLVYPLLSKGKLGDSQMAWFKEHLLDPYGRAIENLSSDRIQMMQDFKQLKKSLEVPKDLRKTNDSGFTNEQAVRVYLFNKMGYDIPGLSKTDLTELVDIINADGKLKAFADQILSVTKGDGYVKPSQEWLAGTITTDLIDLLNTTKRRKYLEQSGYLNNANEIFSTENLNKLEAAYGAKYREAVENILSRMKSGKNRMFSGNRLSNRVLDYINGSIGTIMFFNTRSAVLQTISAVNFLNWSFNNPYKAGKAFANQKQYWKDFKMLMNSDYLTDRRNGLKLNINENEIANAAATAKNKARGVMNYILQKGYLPTQFADSFAIASGGATFYRNRVNDLVNQGVELKQAEQQALSEWKETAEISQQSSDPSKISQQQASDLGRVILAFANTPMQYARIQKRAFQDLVNKRGDAKTHVSKIIYYGVVQNLIFNALQQALFAIGFGDDEDEENEKKYLGVANGMLDSTLRGLGIAGATVAVIKNFLMDIYERSGRKRPEYVDSVYKLLQLSPPISSKISKIRQAAYQFDSKKRREEIFEKGFSLDNPAYEAAAKIISATTNLPLDRVLNKVNNIEAALGEDAETWQIIAMLAGWPEWQIMAKEKKKEELPKFEGAKVKTPTKTKTYTKLKRTKLQKQTM